MSLTITKAGLLDTVQDLGRYGYQHQGINPGGAMDRDAARLANALLGKDQQAPVIELHFPAAQILMEQPAVICITGADFTPCINGEVIPLHQPVAVRENSLLRFSEKRNGARCYLAIANELLLQTWLHSYSTNLKAAAGGYKGRRLQKGDRMGFAPLAFRTTVQVTPLPWRYKVVPLQRERIEVFPGPEWHWLTPENQAAFFTGRFTLLPASDRMGYRLQGPVLEQAGPEQLVSSAVDFGTVQLLPSGQLIVLMADHQTTGGYPRIASVAANSLAQLAQAAAGDDIGFISTTIETAEKAFVGKQKLLRQLQNTCKLKFQNWLHAH